MTTETFDVGEFVQAEKNGQLAYEKPAKIVGLFDVAGVPWAMLESTSDKGEVTRCGIEVIHLRRVGTATSKSNGPDVNDTLRTAGSDAVRARHDKAKPYKPKPKRHAKRFGQTSAEFVKGFVPPDYLFDGILQRRFIYSFTGKTGSGKTAAALLIAASVALGRSIGNREVAQGKVFYFAGENADDVRMRWIAMAPHMDFDVNIINVRFYPGVFKISEMYNTIVSEAQDESGVALVIVDTSAAYFEGDDANSNTQQAEHARRLRSLTNLPGGPAVLVNCHPVKNAAADNLVPYGGGAFLNEVDGNLTCAIDGPAIEVHWQGKFRGPDFQPLNFKVRSVTHERLKDSRGRLVPSVIAEHLSEIAQQEIAKAGRAKADQLLVEISRDGNASWADYARRCGWLTSKNEPYKSLVGRTLKVLKAQKLIADDRGGFTLTEKGRKALEKIGPVAGPILHNQAPSDQPSDHIGPLPFAGQTSY